MKFQLFVSLMLAASSLALVAPGSADHDLSKRSPQTLSHTAALTSRYESPRGQSSCQDQEKIDACQARGPEWSCDGNCKCQGPPKECHDDDKWKICLGEGKHADDKCQCKCPRKDMDACEGGYLDNTCHCIKPSHKHRRSLAFPESCNPGLTACLVPGGRANRYECLDTTSTLDSCGGCTSQGQGADCTALEGASDVQCLQGKCLISSCDKGWLLAFNGTMCIPKGALDGSVVSGALKGAEKVLGW
ncbi:hypothetical protein JCM24511_03500 [Saitozyma sp. JCM 24511]|nr:hypothetical protein JCM24511_03500 [Saitozyma sp. JCM 24511]